MALPPVIRVDQLEAGEVVRVLLTSAFNSRFANTVSRTNGLFRVREGEEPETINEREWRKIVGFNRRKFLAKIIVNDTERQELRLSIEDSHTTKHRKVRYEVNLPYNQIMRLSRLVQNSREFDSFEDEEKFRRQFRQSAVNKAYFSPYDRFAGVELIALASGAQMVTNFTHQIAVLGSSHTISLPVELDDADYTVTYGYNTVVGSAAPTLNITDLSKTTTEFVIATVDGTDIQAGTTIDFHVIPR